MAKVLYLILGAGKPVNQEKSISLQEIFLNKPTIEHQIKLSRDTDIDLFFVSGHQDIQIRALYPEVSYIHNEDWPNTSSAYSLLIALNRSKYTNYTQIVISYGDVLINLEMLEKLVSVANSEINVLINSDQPSRVSTKRLIEKIQYKNNSFEFSGVICCNFKVLENFHSWLNVNLLVIKKMTLSDALVLYHNYEEELIKINIIEAKSNWAHIEHSSSLSRFAMGTKASTLATLYGNLNHSYVLPLFIVKRNTWDSNRQAIINSIMNELESEFLIVRSSSIFEDNEKTSGAGKFLSIANVPADVKNIARSITAVFNSYGEFNRDPNSEVLIQPFKSDLNMVGVVMTRSIPYSGPYFVIELTREKSAETITSGKAGEREIWKILKNSNYRIELLPNYLQDILKALEELQLKLLTDKLDVEFGIDIFGKVIIFQARHLIVRDDMQDTSADKKILSAVKYAEEKLISSAINQKIVSSDRYFYSNMSDWNPAEIIGKQPTKLAFDLYDFLVTGSNWASQRKQSGYSSPLDTKLMIKILGKAFIDLKKSIYSFIPDTVDENVKQLILNGALNYVDENSNLHDKVEFLVLPTCINFELNSYRQIYPYLNELENSDYSAYVDALRSVTNSVIDYVLTDKHESTFCLESLNSIISKGQSLRQTLEFCKDVEVLKFAHYARASFIASSFMRSTVSKGIFSEERLSEFWRGTNNLTSIMRNDAYALKLGEMKYEVFLERYGHLRPGTYNLESLTYQESPDKFLIPLIESAVPSTQIAFNLTEKERDLIDLNLKEIGISLNSEMFLNFVKNATAGREILKLKFTKTLSRCLDQIVEVGSRLGLSREELNHLNLEYILDLNDEVATHPNILDELKTIALINKQKFMFFSKIELPDFLSNKIKLNAFQVMKHQPSFPSKKNISAVLYKIISGEKFDIEDISGKLVGIENADPGYEFLFASSIAGLITAYGGPNSHMSIRCAELNLPGVIGVGSEAFSSLNTGDFVEINSLGLMYRVLG